MRYTFRTANEWNKWEDEKRRGCLSVAWVLTVAESGVLSQHQHFRGGQRKSRTKKGVENKKKKKNRVMEAKGWRVLNRREGSIEQNAAAMSGQTEMPVELDGRDIIAGAVFVEGWGQKPDYSELKGKWKLGKFGCLLSCCIAQPGREGRTEKVLAGGQNVKRRYLRRRVWGFFFHFLFLKKYIFERGRVGEGQRARHTENLKQALR